MRKFGEQPKKETGKNTHYKIDTETGEIVTGPKWLKNLKSGKKKVKKPKTFKHGEFDYNGYVVSQDDYNQNISAVDNWKNYDAIHNASPDDRQAVAFYGESVYHSINARLRRDDDLGDVQDISDSLDRIISNTETFAGVHCYRGGADEFINGAKSVEEIQAMTGTIVQDKAFCSTSMKPEKAFKNGMLYDIHVPAGKGLGAYIASLTNHEGEYEYLLNRGSYFEITGAREENGRVVVKMEVVFPDE